MACFILTEAFWITCLDLFHLLNIVAAAVNLELP